MSGGNGSIRERTSRALVKAWRSATALRSSSRLDRTSAYASNDSDADSTSATTPNATAARTRSAARRHQAEEPTRGGSSIAAGTSVTA